MIRVLAPVAVAAVVCFGAGARSAEAQGAKARFETARSLEAAARALVDKTPAASGAKARAATLKATRRVVTRYEMLVRRYPRSGYSDNALFQAGNLSRELFEVYNRTADRAAALKYYAWLTREYPSSSLRKQARTAVRAIDAPKAAAQRLAVPTSPAAGTPSVPSTRVAPTPVAELPAAKPAVTSAPSARTLTRIERVALGGLERLTLHLDGEATYSHDLLAGPPRVFVDLQGVEPAASLLDTTARYDDGVVRQVRIGRQPGATRVVLDLAGTSRVSVFTMLNPFRVVVDAESAGDTAPPTPDSLPALPAGSTAAVATGPASKPPGKPVSLGEPARPPARTVVAAATAVATPLPKSVRPDKPDVPSPPAANGDGSFSLARQLGLGVSRIVIDPGHGGHDPGTLTKGSTEAAVVLDVALRLERLLKKEQDLEVVLTRRTNTFVHLDQRTAIANREGADLFLSIHANASRNLQARGIETYYLSFASNPEAEAVAARENVTSKRDMHNLSGIVRAIALNNKLDESRDFASMVQKSLAGRLLGKSGASRNRGVKKAPFVVLIGAGMPSILAEIGFLTNRSESSLLKTPAYRQRVAQALHASVMSYRRELKRQTSVATR